MNRHFSNEDIQMGNRHMKKMFKIISHQGQIKTTLRYHLMLVRMAKIDKAETRNAGEDVEKGDPSYIVGGNAS